MQDELNVIDVIKPLISEDRLSGYNNSYARSLCEDPLKVYQWNMLLSESFYPLLHIIEVSFRNKLHGVISEHFNDQYWLTAPHILFSTEQKFVEKALNKPSMLHKRTIGHSISELSFGFWTGLLDRRYETKQLFWPKLLRNTFPYLSDRKIHIIRRKFNKIRKLRNRVWHYESIWHWSNLLELHQSILDAITWIEPKMINFVDINRVPEIYVNGPQAINFQN